MKIEVDEREFKDQIKEFKDYLEYSMSQPMRDGEEISNFLNDDEVCEKEET